MRTACEDFRISTDYDIKIWERCTTTKGKITVRVLVSRTAQAVIPRTINELTHWRIWAIVDIVPQGCLKKPMLIFKD